ncbi:ATP-binding protein [Maribellus sp. CM-23]|uniref:ATP-binding protein n=1 Tax=Maribellus sp. CM-23 TaxID=2781026 RepID=UPI001F17AEDD|nr:ATP-binding protein [Maribellus sp. CM-23]MCE4566019.1 ATP-binding protein [Maribellus sp. CM-23]
MINREIASRIMQHGTKYPVIAVTGPRQSGKTTLLKSAFPDYEYVSLENPDNRNFAETDPNGFFSRYSRKIILDEVQRVPALFSYIQTLVDESGERAQFILSGSQNFHLMESITQSLAGRVAIFRLFPFDFQELQSEGLLDDDYLDSLVRGFYPAIYDRDIPSRIFYSNYIQTYVQRDVSELVAIKNIRLFQNFLGLCAARAGQLLNLNSLANECGISQPTAKSWLSALENSYIVFQLFPYHENFSKRIVKTPKLYFYDSGLLCYLLKISSSKQLLTHSVKGNLFENMMVAEYVKRISHKNTFEDVWFWRDSNGNEVDLIIQEEQQLNLVEIKAGQTVMSDMFSRLLWWENLTKQKNLTKTLVYGGNERQSRSIGEVMPWRDFGK